MACEVCKNPTAISLSPDYCSTGMWCKGCGVEVTGEDTDLSAGLVALIQGWNDLWMETCCTESKCDTEYYHDLLIQSGEELAKYVRHHHPCTVRIIFDDDRTIYENGELRKIHNQ